MHKAFMQLALEEAEAAFLKGEVPIGAVAVKNGEVIAKAHNLREILKDPTAHAEVLVMRQAAEVLGTWHLNDVTIYVTLEPCPMCAGAMLQARLTQVVFGTMDAKAGAVGSVINILESRQFNHQVQVIAGIMEEECKEILQRFFLTKR